MPLPILLLLLLYIGTLAATQTAHGGGFLSLRWVFLAGFTLISLFYWVTGRIPRRDAIGNQGAPNVVWAYLLLTLMSVAFVHNYGFSGLRWITHAMLILTFMILLRGTLHERGANGLVLMLKGILVILLVVSFFMPAPRTVYDNLAMTTEK